MANDESLAQDQIDDIEEEEKYYLRKIQNAFYIQIEACCTVITYRLLFIVTSTGLKFLQNFLIFNFSIHKPLTNLPKSSKTSLFIIIDYFIYFKDYKFSRFLIK